MEEHTYEKILSLIEERGSIARAAESLEMPRTTLRDLFHRLKVKKFRSQKSKDAIIKPPSSDVQYFIFTAAQDETIPHEGFLNNIEAYAEFRNASIYISGFTYAKKIFSGVEKNEAQFHPSISKYITKNRIHLGDYMTFCGEMNTLPTAVNPLSGFETYTHDKSGIFPHAKIQVKSIPTAKGDFAKIIMTTGSVTLPNYIQKKAGIKAEHFHEIAAVIVELLPDGKFFYRHLVAEEDGSFQDLTYYVQDGIVSNGHVIEAFNPGDIHAEQMDSIMTGACWGYGKKRDFLPLVDYLKPKYQFLHDVSDFRVRNHHNIGDPHFRFKMYMNDTDIVEDGIKKVSKFLEGAHRDFCKTIVVESNHDLALMKWLKHADYRYDPPNARFFLELQLEVYRSIEYNNTDFQILPWALRRQSKLNNAIKFLKEDESYVICSDIECGMHGHNGANGARPSPLQFSRMGKKSNTGHTHSASKTDGHYCAGVLGKLDQGYNKGLSSWSPTNIITYPNGKRTLITHLPTGEYCADIMKEMK